MAMADQRRCSRRSATFAVAALAASGSAWGAEPARHDHELDSITVTARRLADEHLRQQVEEALAADRMLVSDHFTVEIHNGVAVLSGVVYDDWDIRLAKRIVKRVPGVKRVLTMDLDIEDGT